MTDGELAEGNERLNALAMKSDPSDEELSEVVAAIRAAAAAVIRDYADKAGK